MTGSPERSAQETRILGSPEIVIKENQGYNETELLKFLAGYPRVTQVMNADSLAFGKGDQLRFPSPVSPEEEKSDPELANRAFRRRVALHTVSVGATMHVMLEAMSEAGAVKIDDTVLSLATQVMALHDLKKLNEILWRSELGSSDAAYDAAEAHLEDLLLKAQYPKEYVQLAGSIGHNGAKDYLTAPDLWTPIRQCAYLADELHQETVIQTDPLDKVRRLKTDPRYAEANAVGFPARREYPGFTNEDGSLTPKFDIQGLATMYMAENVGKTLDIRGQDLGKYLIVKSTQQGLYQAKLSF